MWMHIGFSRFDEIFKKSAILNARVCPVGFLARLLATT